jgi:hypothetical protein
MVQDLNNRISRVVADGGRQGQEQREVAGH